jgi:protein involved in polysaccharide export with SLBB domain
MRDRLFSLVIAATVLAAIQNEGWAQGAMKPGMGPGGYPNRPELANPDAGNVPTAMAMPVERPTGPVDPNRKLHEGDELTFKIEEDREPTIPLVVSHAGEIIVDPLERPVKVTGMTTSQAESEIRRLLEKDYYYKATVRLTLARANVSATMSYIYLDGKIGRVGPLPLYQERPMKLSEAILTAGGFTQYADKKRVKVVRTSRDGSQLITVDMSRMDRGDVSGDIFLQPGDRVVVPEKWIVY